MGHGDVPAVNTRQLFHGSLRWLPAEEGGLRSPLLTDRWVRPAWIEPGDIQHVASLVITGIVPGETVSPHVEAFWLAWERLPEDEWDVQPGDSLAVTEGPRAVAYLEVERVDADC